MGLTPIQLGPDDPGLAAVHALIHHCFAPMETRINPPSSVRNLTLDTLRQQARDAEVWTLSSPPCACILLTPRPGCLYLSKLSTAQDARQKGHARRLIDHAARRAKSQGLPAIELQSRVELTENHRAFQALGFSEVARTTHAGFDTPTSITFRRTVV